MGSPTLEKAFEECARVLEADRKNMREEVDAIAKILRTDPAAHVLDTHAMALRLWLRGVRA